jgi:hypothetical protein
MAVGMLLIVDIAGFYVRGPAAFTIRAAAIAMALLAIYVVLHRLLRGRGGAAAGRWLASVVAIVPLVGTYVLGLGNGPVFGSGAGQVGALTFLGISLIVAGIRGDIGCEVMALPNALFGMPCEMACLVFSPVDRVEKHLSARNGP